MVVVYRIGRAPINYKSNLLSYSTFITVALYLSAIIFPYLIGGWCYHLFTRYEIEPQIPTVSLNPDIEFSITGKSCTALYFQMNQYASTISKITRVPVIQIPQLPPSNTLKFSAYFPIQLNETINNVHLSFSFLVNFAKQKKTFTSYVDIDEFSYLSASAVNIFGSLIFTQEQVLNGYTETFVPLSDAYIQYTRKRTIRVNSSYPVTQGDPIFIKRNVIWNLGPTDLFEVHFSMRAPVVKTVVQVYGFFSFLDGWSTYLSFALPFFVIVRMILSAFFRSGIVPVQRECEAELNTEKIPKFNR